MWRVLLKLFSGVLVIIPGTAYAVDGTGFGWPETLLLPFMLVALGIGYLGTLFPNYTSDGGVYSLEQLLVAKQFDLCREHNSLTQGPAEGVKFNKEEKSPYPAVGRNCVTGTQVTPAVAVDFKIFELPSAPLKEIRSDGYGQKSPEMTGVAQQGRNP